MRHGTNGANNRLFLRDDEVFLYSATLCSTSKQSFTLRDSLLHLMPRMHQIKFGWKYSHADEVMALNTTTLTSIISFTIIYNKI